MLNVDWREYSGPRYDVGGGPDISRAQFKLSSPVCEVRGSIRRYHEKTSLTDVTDGHTYIFA